MCRLLLTSIYHIHGRSQGSDTTYAKTTSTRLKEVDPLTLLETLGTGAGGEYLPESVFTPGTSKEKGGYWEPHGATIDFCEDNYVRLKRSNQRRAARNRDGVNIRHNRRSYITQSSRRNSAINI